MLLLVRLHTYDPFNGTTGPIVINVPNNEGAIIQDDNMQFAYRGRAEDYYMFSSLRNNAAVG